ncbi:MAG TPA: formyltransferase [Gammaproteobacteria bacterium]|nr:formyltransferase [Gammaproteobacteria bacterium]
MSAAERARAVVFAYHDVGVRGLETLLARGVDVLLVVTHEDDPAEAGWFASVADHARRYGIDTITPAPGDLPALGPRLAALAPDFLFSFYYRHLLPAALIETARGGAFNLHGSLLPRYRGRAPVNWAVLAGETETGASLHYMTARADAGDLVAQESVPILPNDTAAEVMTKISVAGERLLWRVLPELIAGTAPRKPLDLAAGNYCGRRRPEDGRIDWSQGAWAIHNLVRAVAPPYPGAFSDIGGGRLFLLGSHFRNEAARHTRALLYVERGRMYADCADSFRFEVLKCAFNDNPVTAASFPFAGGEYPLSGDSL